MAVIHEQLAQDCIVLGSFSLNWLLLNKDASYPWFILVPDREDISEIYQLSRSDQQQLIAESSYFSQTLAQKLNADKMNVAALGNVVPQLHIHHIVRYKNDVAWPAPVWGYAPAQSYSAAQLEQMHDKIKSWKLRDFNYSARP